MAEYEYRWNQGTSGDWITFEELQMILSAWNNSPAEYGLPTVSISKRVKVEHPNTVEHLYDCFSCGKERARSLLPKDTRGPRCGDVTTVSSDAGEHQYTCDRDPGHTPPHRDVQQKGRETVSWSRTLPTRKTVSWYRTLPTR